MRSFRLYRFPECQGKMFVVVTVVLLTSGVTLLSEMLNLHQRLMVGSQLDSVLAFNTWLRR